jgi:hypothetical protein
MNQLNNDNYSESISITMNLESLSAEYKNKLVEYEQAIANYVNYLKQETDMPCGLYSPDTRGINQRCYDAIWQKAGCGAGTLHPQANWSWQQSQTMDDLINDSHYWATMTDYNHRMGCYGNPGNSYIILGIGTDGRLWSRQGLDAPWQLVNDDAAYDLVSICTGNDGKTIIASNRGYNIYTKPSWDASNWQGPIHSPCCVIGVAMAQDGTLVGVGMDNRLWSKPYLNGEWTQTTCQGEWIAPAGVAIAPDGSIYVVGGDNFVYKKNSYKDLPSQQWWQRMDTGSNTCCVKAITIAPDGTFIGVGTDDQLWTKANYKDLTTPWIGPYNSENGSCCVIAITTVVNPNYNISNYNQNSKPNYDINAQPLVSIKGSTFLGTGEISLNNTSTLEECSALCSSTYGCTGATFNGTQPACSLRTGEGILLGGSDSNYAIIPKGKQLLSVVQNINIELTNINKQIQQLTNNGQPLYNSNTQKGNLQNINLISQFVQLTKERERINNMLNEYQTLDQEQTEGSIMINQNYYSFWLLLSLVIIFFIILYKFGIPSTSQLVSSIQSGGELGINAYYILFGIILVIIIANFIQNRYSL